MESTDHIHDSGRMDVISGQLAGVINGKLAERQQIVPIVLTMVDEGPQSVFPNPII